MRDVLNYVYPAGILTCPLAALCSAPVLDPNSALIQGSESGAGAFLSFLFIFFSFFYCDIESLAMYLQSISLSDSGNYGLHHCHSHMLSRIFR